MLHGAHTDGIYPVCASLLDTVKHPLEEIPVLERTNLDLSLQEIDAELDANNCDIIWILAA